MRPEGRQALAGTIAGRFAWASVSDYIGREATYVVFFALGMARSMHRLPPPTPAWVAVGIPLAWGIWITITKAARLFQ
jgi:hypothetical protein